MLALLSTSNNAERPPHWVSILSATSCSFVLSRHRTCHAVHKSLDILLSFLQKLQNIVKGEGQQTYLHLLHGLDADPTALPSLRQLLLKWVHQDDGAQTRRFSPLHVVEECSGFFRFVTDDCGNVSWKKSSQTSCLQ